MRKNVIKRVGEEAGRFRSKTGVDPTVVYLGTEELREAIRMRLVVGRPVKFNTGIELATGWGRLTWFVGGRKLQRLDRDSYVGGGL
jgi:hypothetical protein